MHGFAGGGCGRESAPSGAEHKFFFANGAQRLVKAILAQIDFSWSRNAKTSLENSIGQLWCSHKIFGVGGGGGGGGSWSFWGRSFPPPPPLDRTLIKVW